MTSFVKMYSGGPIYKFGLNSAIVVANSHRGITYLQTVLFLANITTYIFSCLGENTWYPIFCLMYISCDMKLDKYTFSMLNITVTTKIFLRVLLIFWLSITLNWKGNASWLWNIPIKEKCKGLTSFYGPTTTIDCDNSVWGLGLFFSINTCTLYIKI